MASLRKICEDMNKNLERDLWDRKKITNKLDDKSMAIILRGLEVRPDRKDGNTFWDDFLKVIVNNSDDASHLLGVDSSIMSLWSSKIREGIKKARDKNATHMIHTGNIDSIA